MKMADKPETKLDGISNLVENIRVGELTIDENKILRIQGYRDLGRVRPKIRVAAEDAARETEAIVEPLVYFRFLSVDSCQSGVLKLQNGITFENEAFDRFIAEARLVVVFILTMGRSLDQAVKAAIADDQLLRALFLETAGWIGIEAATKKFSHHLRSMAREQSCRLSLRLGPGYSYKLDGRSVIWPLEQQRTLFKIFEGHSEGIELLESCAMLPKISRSGIFGLIPIPRDAEL